MGLVDQSGILTLIASTTLKCPDTYRTGQLQANPPVTGQMLSPGKPTQRTATMMGSNDLVISEDDLVGPSCQRYNW